MRKIKFTTFIDNIETNLDVFNSLNSQVIRIEKFFDTRINEINLILAINHNHLCKLIKKSRPLWGVSTNVKNTIFIYDPKTWIATKTGHSYKDLNASISHQIVHIFLRQSKIKTPNWFEEGLATFIGYNNSDKQRHTDYLRLSKEYGIPNILDEDIVFSKTEVPALRYLTAEKFVGFLYKSNNRNFLKIFKERKGDNFKKSIKNLYNREVEEIWNDFKKHE